MNKNYLYIGIGVAILLALAVLGKKRGWWGEVKGIEVAVEAAAKRDIFEKVNAQGTLFSATEIKISSEVSGEIIGLHTKEGAWVNKGDLILEINPSIYKTLIDQAQAQVNQMKANLATVKARNKQAIASYAIAEKDYARKEGLYKKDIIAIQEFNQSESQYLASKGEKEASEENVHAAEFQLENAQAGFKQAQENLSRTKIYAPMSGTVSKQSVELGERVVGTAQMSGTELIRISDLNNMEVRVDVSENDIVKTNIGDSAIIDIESYPEIKFKGVVSQKAYSSNQNSMITDKVTNFIVRIKLDKTAISSNSTLGSEQFPFRPGMTASADIITNKAVGVIAVPIQCVTTREKEKNKDETDEVIFFAEKNKAVKSIVKTGIQDDNYIEIKSGVKLGDKVIKAPFRVIAKTIKADDVIVEVDEEKLNNKKEK